MEKSQPDKIEPIKQTDKQTIVLEFLDISIGVGYTYWLIKKRTSSEILCMFKK